MIATNENLGADCPAGWSKGGDCCFRGGEPGIENPYRPSRVLPRAACACGAVDFAICPLNDRALGIGAGGAVKWEAVKEGPSKRVERQSARLNRSGRSKGCHRKPESA